MPKKGLFKRIIKGIGTTLDVAVLGGAITQNVSSTPESPSGQNNVPMIIGGVVSSIALIAFIYLLVTGKITFDQFLEAVETVKN